MSEWTPPAGATTADYPGRAKDGAPALVRMVKDQGREMRDRFSNLLKSAGLHVNDAGVTFDKSVTILGDLSVPNGSITNDALTNPIVPAAFYESATAWATSSVFETKVTQSLTVPEGFTSGVVSASAWATAENTSGATNIMYVRPVVNGSNGPADYTRGILPDTSASGQASYSRLLTGLTPGATVTITAEIRTGSAYAATSTNAAVVSGVVLWLR